MTPDEIETRIYLLELRVKVTQALVHTLLPATLPARRDVVLRQFGQYCAATEEELQQGVDAAMERNWQLGELARMYESLEGALNLLPEWEARQSATKKP